MNVIPNEAVLRQHLVEATAWVAEQMRRCELSPESFTLTVTIEASVEKNDAKLVYRLDHRRNYDSAVEGNSLAAVTFELLRRSGWKKENQALQLTWDGAGAPSLDKEF